MASWIANHWLTVTSAMGAFGVSVRLFPGFWRGLIRAVAAPVLLGIERERRIAREEQVADLLDQVERLKSEAESRLG